MFLLLLIQRLLLHDELLLLLLLLLRHQHHRHRVLLLLLLLLLLQKRNHCGRDGGGITGNGGPSHHVLRQANRCPQQALPQHGVLILKNLRTRVQFRDGGLGDGRVAGHACGCHSRR